MRDERGGVIVVVTLALAAILGMTVLVVDVGGLLTLRRRMVLTADAAALAAAQSCGREEAFDAQTQADALAEANQSDALATNFETEDCGGSASGRVEVGYAAPKTLFFAPVLGHPETKPVSAEAEAIWGPAGGVTPVPIELSIDPNGQIDCVYKDPGTECKYWHDNNARDEFANSSNWGFMNLGAGNVSVGDSCPSAGTDERRDWITGAADLDIRLTDGLSLICADSGHSNSSWFTALQEQIGHVKYFPVNDPAQMDLTSGKEKYAIIGFVPLQIEDVLRGNDPAAIGTPGASGSCRESHSFTNGSQLDLTGFSCMEVADVVSNLRIYRRQGNATTEYQQDVHFTLDPNSHVITWFSGNVRDVNVEFDWSAAGSEGKCGSRASDPNGVCLVLSWQGVRVAGSLPGSGADFGLRAVRLDG
jgi:hypothetical protein